MHAPTGEEEHVVRASVVFQAAPLFRTLESSIIDVLAHAAICTEYTPQAVVFLMGDHDHALYVVETGWLKAVKSAPTGREHIIATFGPGDVLNDIAALAEAPTQATVIALEPTILWRIAQDDLHALVERYPALAWALIGNLATRVIYLAGLVEDLALRPVEARLARLILFQARDNQLERRRWATQAELAGQIGAVPDVLNRALRTLAEAGLIAVDRRRIRILDRAGLEERAQLS